MRNLHTAIKTVLLTAGLCALAVSTASAQVLSGSYIGNGVDVRQIQVGFVPDFVMVKGDTTQIGAFRSSTMVGDASKPASGATALQADMIQSLDTANSGGFTVGTNASVNSSGVTYHWIAFKAVTGKMEVGTYVGNGVAGGQAISGVGLAPNLVFIMSAGAAYAVHKSSAHTNTNDFEFSAGIANLVSSLDADGFTLGSNDARVNAASTTYHYVAWTQVAGEMKVSSYVGNAAAQNITGLGFEPEFVMIKAAASAQDATGKTASTGRSIDSSIFYRNLANAAGRVTALITDGFSIGTTNSVSQTGQTFTYYAWKRTSAPIVITGSYTGTGATQSITQLGFQPDVVIVKQEASGGVGQITWIKTSTMSGANSKPMTGATAFATTAITSLDAVGFTVGTNAAVNGNTKIYHFIAFKAAPSTMKVGTYVGNGLAGGPSVTAMGFSPELVFIFSPNAIEPMHQSTGSSGNAFSFTTTATATGYVTLGTDGFSITSTNTRVNASGVTYHYIAWNESPGFMDIGTYTGNGADLRNITGVGFEPEYLIVKENAVRDAVMKPASSGRSVDVDFFFSAGTGTNPPNEIQLLQTDGFQVGTDFQVNENTGAYVYYAWRRPAAAEFTAVQLTSMNATRYGNRVLVDWKTGYEVDNLGFNVYREIDGSRVRITRSLVGGSGLMTGEGTAVRSERHYAFWDTEAQAGDTTAVYWIEDVDFKGGSVFHGPITPVEGGLGVIPETAPSSALHDLGKHLKRHGRVFSMSGAKLETATKSKARPVRSGSTIPAEVQTQRLLAAQGAMKIGVEQAGWYRVTQPELVAAGFDAHIDPASLRLFADGVEVAMAVNGAGDGRFDAADSIEFYGTGVDTPYTGAHVYWLVAGGRGSQRVTVRGAAGKAGSTSVAASFPFIVQQKERSIYFAALRNGDDENWFGAFISEEATDLTMNVTNIVAGAPGQIEVSLQGVTSTPDVDPDHQVAIAVNGADVGVLSFDGQAKGTQTFTVPAGVLANGANTVTIVSRGGEADYSLVDVVRLSYPHTYRADADLLRFTATGPGDVTVTGFASGNVRVVDVTDPLAVEELNGTVRPQDGLFAVTIRVPSQGVRTLLAFTDATMATPAFIRSNAPSQWSSTANGADYIAISPSEFTRSLAPLVERRAKSGLTVATVNIDDVYDEFSFGEKTPQALKDFVTFARTQWKKAPRFLLLVGDATIDPRDYAGFGDADFVPTKQVPMAQISLETASDDWFADADNDGLPELAVGRLPVRTPGQADDMVAKVLAYEDSDGTGWSHRVLLVADQNDENSDFEASVDALGRDVPAGYDVQRVLAGVSGADIAALQLTDGVNRGQLIVNYTGHGSVRIWGTEGTILTSETIAASWQNAATLPFVVAMNCLNGFFHGIYDEESLAETLLRTSGGGAVAAWASSGLTDSATQSLVNRELFRLLFGSTKMTIGQAAALAKQSITNPDVRRSWIFFGDPALRLKGN